MKKIFVFLLCTMTISASRCDNRADNCHYYIQIKNNSSNQIISAIPVRNADNKCKLDGTTINNEGQYNYKPFNFCIENSLDNYSSIELYIVDPSQFNAPNIYYNCDSIGIINKVLKHYVLTLEELKKNNFVVTYSLNI